MNNQRNLLSWILGGLSVAAVAVVITVASTGKPVAPGSPAGAAAAHVTSAPDSQLPAPATAAPLATEPTVAATPTVVPASLPDPETALAPEVQAQAAAEPGVQSGQIWQCVTNGVKTFSNNPCGEKSSLLEVRAINTMNPTPVVRYARASGPEPRYTPAYAEQDAYADQEVYSEPGAETGVNSYTVVQGFAFLPRRGPQHPHHRPPFHHNPGDNPGHHPGHNPGPMPRRN
jgi:hypothetical protein